MRATPSRELSPRCFGYAVGRGESIAEGLLSPAHGARKIGKKRCPGLLTEALFLFISPNFLLGRPARQPALKVALTNEKFVQEFLGS